MRTRPDMSPPPRLSSRSEIRFGLRRYDPVFAIEILLLRFTTRLLVGDRSGFDPGVANREHFLADPFGQHESAIAPARCRADSAGPAGALALVARSARLLSKKAKFIPL
jgi:hypothetical protein